MARRQTDPWKKKSKAGSKVLNNIVKGSLSAGVFTAKVVQREYRNSKQRNASAAQQRERDYKQWKNRFYELYESGAFIEASEHYKKQFPFHIEQDAHVNYKKLKQIDRERPFIVLGGFIALVLILIGLSKLINWIF